MKVHILTSGFTNGFTAEIAKEFNNYIVDRTNFVFIASEFNLIYERTDYYCKLFTQMFRDINIYFENIYVIDSRISKEVAQDLVETANVLWLAGGDTLSEYKYIKSYGLIPFIQNRDGITIGMSAGSINMAKTSICTVTCEHEKQEIYAGLGLQDITIEPHLNADSISDELLQLSKNYKIYGMCDDSAIICQEGKITYIGDIYLIEAGKVNQISTSVKTSN